MGTENILEISPKKKRFSRNASGCTVSPQPVITRWGTWLAAASYYAKHYFAVKSVVNTLNSREAIAIKKAKRIFAIASVEEEVKFIHTQFSEITNSIQHLQNPNLPLQSSLNIINKTMNKLTKVRLHPKGKQIYLKLRSVLKSNPGYETVRMMNKVIQNEEVETTSKVNKNTLQHFEQCKYLPITSVDVERSFSHFDFLYFLLLIVF